MVKAGVRGEGKEEKELKELLEAGPPLDGQNGMSAVPTTTEPTTATNGGTRSQLSNQPEATRASTSMQVDQA